MASASGTVFVWSKTSVYPPALSHGKGGGSGGYTPAALPEIAQPGQAVKGKPPQTADVPPLDCPFPAALQNIRRRGIYHHRAHPRRGAFTSGQSVQKRGPVTSPSPFSCPAAPVRAAVSLSTRPASSAMICSFILAGVTSLPKYLDSSAVEIITPRSSFFFFT